MGKNYISLLTKFKDECRDNILNALIPEGFDTYVLVTEELKKGEKVQLVGFGTFEVSERPAREGRNPQTGETMTIAASKAPKFKAGKALKDAVNE